MEIAPDLGVSADTRGYAARAGRGFLICTRLSQNSTTGPAIYTDEYVPVMKPTSSVNADGRRIGPPSASSAISTEIAVPEVRIVRDRVSLIARFITTASDSRRRLAASSRIRSDTIMVSCTE